MGQMRNRLRRMDFKSLGAILQMQDRLAAEWLKKAAPPAVVVEQPPTERIGGDKAPKVTPPPLR
jgi:hypothetical protein